MSVLMLAAAGNSLRRPFFLYSFYRLAKYLPQQLRRGHLTTQHTLALLPHLGRYLTALHADGGLRVLHGICISFSAALVHRNTPRVTREESGACGRIRTGDLLITSALLCQLRRTRTVKYQKIV